MVSATTSPPDGSLYAYLMSSLADKSGPNVPPFTFGIREVKSMIVQDMLPVELCISDNHEHPNDLCILWRRDEEHWCLVDMDVGIAPHSTSTVASNMCQDITVGQLDDWWGVRIFAPLITRVVKRKQVSEARAKGKLSRSKQSIEEEEENDESQWSRRGQSLVESNSLRRDLMAMEKRSDRTTIKDVYNNFMGWLQEEKGMSREDVLKADAMACSTFGRWYGEQKQELSTNKRWRENIAAYIAQHIDSK